MQIARALPVNPIKFDGKTFYSISIGGIFIWVHTALIENNMVILKGKRFCLDMVSAEDDSINYYLYPGENNLTSLRSTKRLYVSDGEWIMSNYNGTYYYLIEHKQDNIIVNNTIDTFEIRDNKIVSVQRHIVHGRFGKEIDLDGEW